LVPNFASLYFERGFTYLAKGEQEKGIEDMKEALRLDPEMEGAKKILKDLEEANGESEQR
jgi:Tfp pilus assembly protein PilF